MRIGQRATTIVDEGPYAGTLSVVDQIIAWPVFALARAHYDAFQTAEAQEAELAAIRDMAEFYTAEARPAWNIEEPRGPVPTTVSGYLRLPVPLSTQLYQMWLASYPLDQEPVTDG